MHMPYTCHARAMHVSYHAHATHVLCMCRAMRVPRHAQNLITHSRAAGVHLDPATGGAAGSAAGRGRCRRAELGRAANRYTANLRPHVVEPATLCNPRLRPCAPPGCDPVQSQAVTLCNPRLRPYAIPGCDPMQSQAATLCNPRLRPCAIPGYDRMPSQAVTLCNPRRTAAQDRPRPDTLLCTHQHPLRQPQRYPLGPLAPRGLRASAAGAARRLSVWVPVCLSA